MAGELFDHDYTWYRDATADVPMRACPACIEGRCIMCAGLGYDIDDMGQPCEFCGGTGECEVCEGEGEIVDDRDGPEDYD